MTTSVAEVRLEIPALAVELGASEAAGDGWRAQAPGLTYNATPA